VWAGPADTPGAARRLEQPGGLTEEEQLVRNERIYKVFNIIAPTPDELLSDERRRKAGKKTTLTPYKSYMGGVYQVYREQNATYLDTIYEDLDLETHTMESLIENCAFHEDIGKRQRIQYLMSRFKWKLDPRTGKFPGGSAGAIRKTKQSRRKRGATKKATSALHKRLNTACNNNTGEHQHLHTPWNWTRPGIFSGVGVTQSPPGSPSPPGPGLPGGDSSGDDD